MTIITQDTDVETTYVLLSDARPLIDWFGEGEHEDFAAAARG